MGHSRRDVSRSTFDRYAYSTKVLHSMRLGSRGDRWSIATSTLRGKTPILAESRQILPRQYRLDVTEVHEHDLPVHLPACPAIRW
jgi:hypothetical protein